MSRNDVVRLAIIGCGAAAELHYLPTSQHLPGARVTLLVDANAERRDHLAARFGVDHAFDDLAVCHDLFDAAIVALPTTLRQSACIKLLTQQKDVLVEQPIALSAGECDELVHTAEQHDRLLTVSLMRRFLWGHRFARSLLKSGSLGRVESFDFREGFPSIQPGVSDFFLRKDLAGGGVLSDTGVHVLDSVLCWLGDFSEVEYFDDAMGGVEANALLNLRLQNGITGVVELSRTRRLRNTAIIHCERGAIEIGLDTNSGKLTPPDQPHVLGGSIMNSMEPGRNQAYPDLIRAQIEDFIGAIRSRGEPEADGRQAKAGIELLEACYRQRKPLSSTWAYQSSARRA